MSPLKKRLLLIAVFALLIIAGSFYSFWQKNSVQETASSIPSSIPQAAAGESNDFVIYVSGAVNHPGVFRIKQGSRIIDAINQAGGLALGADCSKFNLAQEVKDGMQIQVPANIGPQQESNASKKEKGKININTADKKELDQLPGVGPALAERIIEYRKSNGPFKDIAELKKVSGIGEAKFKQIKDKIGL